MDHNFSLEYSMLGRWFKSMVWAEQLQDKFRHDRTLLASDLRRHFWLFLRFLVSQGLSCFLILIAYHLIVMKCPSMGFLDMSRIHQSDEDKFLFQVININLEFGVRFLHPWDQVQCVWQMLLLFLSTFPDGFVVLQSLCFIVFLWSCSIPSLVRGCSSDWTSQFHAIRRDTSSPHGWWWRSCRWLTAWLCQRFLWWWISLRRGCRRRRLWTHVHDIDFSMISSLSSISQLELLFPSTGGENTHFPEWWVGLFSKARLGIVVHRSYEVFSMLWDVQPKQCILVMMKSQSSWSKGNLLLLDSHSCKASMRDGAALTSKSVSRSPFFHSK